MYVQNLFATHMSVVVGLYSLPSVFDYFLVSLSFMACHIRGWALLDCGLCFSLAHPFYHSIIPAAKLFYFNLAGPLWACHLFFS